MSEKIITRTVKLFILIALQLNTLLASNTPTPDAQGKIVENDKLGIAFDANTRFLTQKIADTNEEGVSYYLLYISERKKTFFNLSYTYKSMVILKAREIEGETVHTHKSIQPMPTPMLNDADVDGDTAPIDKQSDKLVFYLKNQKTSLEVIKAAIFSKSVSLSNESSKYDFLLEYTSQKKEAKKFFRLVLKLTESKNETETSRYLKMRTEVRIKTSFEKILTSKESVEKVKLYLEDNNQKDYEEIQNELFETEEEGNIEVDDLVEANKTIKESIDLNNNYKIDQNNKLGQKKLKFEEIQIAKIKKETDPKNTSKEKLEESCISTPCEEGEGICTNTQCEKGEGCCTNQHCGEIVEVKREIEEMEEIEIGDEDEKVKGNKEEKSNPKKILMIVGIIASSLLLIILLVVVIVKVKSNEIKN